MAIINPFNDSHTNNNHCLTTIYVILRRAVSIGNWYLHLICKHGGGRVLLFVNYTVIAQMSLTDLFTCVCTVKQTLHQSTNAHKQENCSKVKDKKEKKK